MIKMIALDIDGTLLNSDKKITPQNKQAIQKAKEQGIKIVLCTGRPLMGIHHLLEELDLLNEGDFSITYNGGLIQKNNTGEVLSQKTLSTEQVQELHDLSLSLNVPMNMIDLEYVYEPTYPVGKESLYPTLMTTSLPFIRREVKEFDTNHMFNKVVFCTNPEELDEAILNIPPFVRQRYSMMKSRPLLFEIMHPEVNKGKGIDTLCRLLGITKSEVMACGDEENDLAMLQYAGVAVVMENGTDEVKKHASFVTKSNDEHGVAHAIEMLALQ